VSTQSVLSASCDGEDEIMCMNWCPSLPEQVDSTPRARLCGQAFDYMENPTEPRAHYCCSWQPRHNPLICEVIANDYTVGFRSSDSNYPLTSHRLNGTTSYISMMLSFPFRLEI